MVAIPAVSSNKKVCRVLASVISSPWRFAASAKKSYIEFAPAVQSALPRFAAGSPVSYFGLYRMAAESIF
jgi:hypothetical protein